MKIVDIKSCLWILMIINKISRIIFLDVDSSVFNFAFELAQKRSHVESDSILWNFWISTIQILSVVIDTSILLPSFRADTSRTIYEQHLVKSALGHIILGGGIMNSLGFGGQRSSPHETDLGFLYKSLFRIYLLNQLGGFYQKITQIFSPLQHKDELIRF